MDSHPCHHCLLCCVFVSVCMLCTVFCCCVLCCQKLINGSAAVQPIDQQLTHIIVSELIVSTVGAEMHIACFVDCVCLKHMYCPVPDLYQGAETPEKVLLQLHK